MVLACHYCNQSKSDAPPTTKEIKRFKMLYYGNLLEVIFGKGAVIK